MSRRRRGRITVQDQTTGAGRAMRRGIGVVHAVMGFVFVVISLTEIFPSAGLFGLPFLAAGGFFLVEGIFLAVSKSGPAHRVGYDVETGIGEEVIRPVMEEPPVFQQDAPDHQHIPPTGLSPKARLEQLETLREAGLLTPEEYQTKRAEILKRV